MTTLLDFTNTVLPEGKVKVPPRPEPAPRPEITVNGTAITEEMVRTEAQNHPAETPAEAFAAAARALVVRELLVQEANRLGLAATPEALGEGRRETDEDALVRALLEREVSAPTADDAACRRYYEQNPRRFRSETLFEARHILFAAPQEDQVARARARDEALAVLAELREAPDSFAELAARHSACPSAGQGGSLGQLGHGSTVPEFDKALHTLQPGQFSSEPVATRFGYHIIQLERRIDGEQLPFEHVAQRIAAWLEAASWSRAVAQYIGILAGKASITGIALNTADGPLVQ
ncbi:peptidylprolyl isomerase [Devosia sp.]|uniref:peptidylprolyl isomerase n=1 Tax=Devosia sp. TaxID=1871048 RepID=UPI002AFE31BD|nr:peptidylprolyl isomerase [Devosia sp.]